jgi:hypothetical protein
MARRHTEKELPSILYKYRHWEDMNHQKMITHHEVYLARPSQYNDPFDCRIPVRGDLLTDEEKNNKNLEAIRITIDDENEVRRIAKLWKDNNHAWFDPLVGKERKEQLDKWDSVAGIFSMSELNNNILMWSHYAKHHEGFVVGFWSDALMRVNEFVHLDYINYSLDFPLISGVDDLDVQFYKKFFYKSDLWSYEKEWRIVSLHKQNRNVILDKSAIAEVIFGSRITEKAEEKIITTLRKNLPDVKLFKAKVSTESFKVYISPIIL